MGTKRPTCTVLESFSNTKTRDCNLKPGGRLSRDPSPMLAMTAQSERESTREEERRQDWEREKMKDKSRFRDTDPRGRYHERDRGPAPRMREAGRDKRQDNERRNGRPLSTVEREFGKEMEWDLKKGDTFPRMRRSRERDEEREQRRPRDKPRRTETDAWDREREYARLRERERDEKRNYEKSRQRHQESNPALRDLGRDLQPGGSRERRERDVARRREIGSREARMPSPHSRRDRGLHPDSQDWERTHRKAGARGTRSEGDSDDRETRQQRARERERDELTYQHSRSEGDSKSGRARDPDRDRHRRRGTDQVGREEERYRGRYKEVDERAAWEGGGQSSERREKEYYRAHGLRKERQRQEREADPRWDDTTLKEAAPRAPPKAQSSGEWSSDMDNDTRRRQGRNGYEEGQSGRESERDDRKSPQRVKRAEQRRSELDRREMAATLPEQRRMWLEPQRGRNSKESSQEDNFVDRERPAKWKEGKGGEEERESQREHAESWRHKYSEQREGINVDREEEDTEELDRFSGSDGEIGENWQRDVKGESNSEESEGGSETGWRPDRDRMLSGEDGFVTVSSGGDDEDEREEFLDCQDYWEGGDTDDTSSSPFHERPEREEYANEEELTEREKKPKYVFCVIGQTLPQPESDRMSPSLAEQEEDEQKLNLLSESLHHSSNDVSRQPSDDLRLSPGRTDEHLMNSHLEPDSNRCRKDGQQSSSSQDDPKMRARKAEHPYAEIGPFKRDSETEKLLMMWRERNKEIADREEMSPLPRNPYADVSPQMTFDQILPALQGLNVEAMSPEQKEAIRIRMSGAWSMSEETKRHSQAPHLKWAKNVVREILGHSGEDITEDPSSGEQAHAQSEESQLDELEQESAEMSFRNLSEDELHSEPELELEEEESLEVEGLRDEDDRSKSWGEVELRNVLDTIGRRKRNSKFFNRAQLYQQYSEAAQNFEILRQSRSDVLSVCEDSSASPAPSPPPARRPLPPLPAVPHPHSLSHTGSITSVRSLPLPEPPRSEGRPSSPRLSITLTESATLWRELPGVRSSSELEDITEDERRLQEVRFEVVTSEASYCRSLDIVVEHFVKSKQLGALLTTQDRNWLFSRLADVRAISHSFLSKLEERLESDIMHFTVCDIIARHCQRFKMVYVPYLTNQSYQDATYQRLMNENQGFRRIVEKLERSPVCQRLPLRSFLVLPFQRITRIKLLVQNIVKRTTAGTAEAAQAIKALRLLEKLIQESNDSISQMKNIESLVSLSAKVDFECRTLPLISQSRRLVREGPVTELMDFSLKDTERNIYMHLFNDYLLLSQQKEGGKFTVIDHAPVAELRAENCRVKLHSLQKNLFRLHMSHKSLLLRTDTQSDKLRWISALSRPHPEVDFSSAQDFPQMQCIRAVVAQQPDELSLEKADIILVHQQSSDHWVEGTRLSDRHRGWVPESHLELIGNARVRQRNLSDALKLTTATAAV
ncbi:trichohyalin isoform X2 [Corythoichthys intestinalis]|uniref:trichohyalin isoform X2 n=1 Tax=Corythoichthys intestinalis TaxID=161448 RepID=UPI0025A68EC0|nr:trichohyalin isoform X2 [Corythoichthys intestinalis]